MVLVHPTDDARGSCTLPSYWAVFSRSALCCYEKGMPFISDSSPLLLLTALVRTDGSPATVSPAWQQHASRHHKRSLSSIDSKIQAEIMERCDELHASLIQPLNDKTAGPLEKANTGGVSSTKMPFVFVLGNHSSGKSSFINYVLGRSIQTAGVAPTDDRCVACWGTIPPSRCHSF